jgi:D-arabinono-1,4-lactone oxidase
MSSFTDPAPTLDFKALYGHPCTPASVDESEYSFVSGKSSNEGVYSADSPPPAEMYGVEDLILKSLPAPDTSILTNDSIPFNALPSYHHATWARTFHSRPEFLIEPQSVEEVQKIVSLARKCRRRVVTIGSGHSPSDLTMTSSWMVRLSNLSRVLRVERYPTEKGPDPIKDTKRYGGRVLFQAGISLEQLNIIANEQGLTLPNLGSIHIQSVAGAIATGTHGSSLRHGLLSQNIRGLRIVLADGRAVWCSPSDNSDLFRAALVSLGGLGIITELEMELAPSCNIEWTQSWEPMSSVLESWKTTLWTSDEYVRCWWMPYLKRMVVWKARKTTKEVMPAKASWYGGRLGYHFYHTCLTLAHYFPRFLPTIEWFVMGMQYGFTTGATTSAVEPQRTGLLMDCLYSQWVNEWAIPLRHGPEAITRLSAWINGSDVEVSGIPFSNAGLYVHSPIEVRVADGSTSTTNPRGFLDPSCESEPTLYLNATLYRPYGLDPPCRERYYEAFEYLMKELGGRPHWAKNFSTVDHQQIKKMYGKNLDRWQAVREEVDPEGMFVGAWQRRLLLGGGEERAEGRTKEGANAGVAEGQGGVEASRLSESDKNEARTDSLSPLLLEERLVTMQSRGGDGGVDWIGVQCAEAERGPGGGGQAGIQMVDDDRAVKGDEDATVLLERLKKEADGRKRRA